VGSGYFIGVQLYYGGVGGARADADDRRRGLLDLLGGSVHIAMDTDPRCNLSYSTIALNT